LRAMDRCATRDRQGSQRQPTQYGPRETPEVDPADPGPACHVRDGNAGCV
jgi:hypothetical protein